MKGIFVVPKFDDATFYSHLWNERMREQIGDRMEKELLLIEDAIRAKDEEALLRDPTAMHVHYDHGSEDAIYGNDLVPVIDLDNVSLLKGRTAYNMNCLSAKTLGKAAYKEGCLAYWGSITEVSFTSDAEEKFGEALNYGLLMVVEGKTWLEALQLARDKMTEIVDELVSQGNGLAAMLLREDRDALHCWGPGIETPTEECPVSRTIVSLFGYKTLQKLRIMRMKVKQHLSMS